MLRQAIERGPEELQLILKEETAFSQRAGALTAKAQRHFFANVRPKLDLRYFSNSNARSSFEKAM